MMTQKHKRKLDLSRTLPYGPDVMFDGSGRCITPKPEIYEFRRTKHTHLSVKDITPTRYATLQVFKHISLFDAYTLVLIVGLLILIGAVLLSGSVKTYNQISFDPDAVADYAVEATGAKILDEADWSPYTFRHISIKKMFIFWKFIEEHNGPQSIIQPWRSPGECWAFSGQKASVRIRLSHTIIPTAITVEHIPKSISPTRNIKAAPKSFTVYAIEEGEPETKEMLGSFEYADSGQATQSFQLHPGGRLIYPTRVIEFSFESNHGHPQYTCVYKVRVHGEIFT